MKIFIFVAITTAILIHIYICLRTYQSLEYLPSLRIPVVIAVILMFLLFIVNQGGLLNFLGITFNQVLHLITSLWIFTILIFLLSFAIADLIRLLDYFFHFIPPIIKDNYTTTKFILMLVLLVFSAFSQILGYLNFFPPQKTELEITINKPQLQVVDNQSISNKQVLNIVAISDLHLGHIINKGKLKRYVDSINAQNPDIVFIIGDLIDRSLEPVIE
jgi:hypothetical protein